MTSDARNRRRVSRFRWIFVVAAAVTAAAIVDPLVEHVSNIGLFGARSFTDHSNADVVPALCVGAACAFAFVVLAVLRSFGFDASRWLARPARDLDALGVRALLPRIYAVQIAALFVMETAEQRIVLGHFFGGTVWLGGPVLVSLTLHLAGCIVVSLLLSRLLTALARRVVAVVRALCASFVLLRTTQTRFVRPPAPELTRLFAPLFVRPIVRPPPLLLA